MTGLARTDQAAGLEKDAADAHKAAEAIKATVRKMRVTWVILASQLYDFNRLKQWRTLGYRSFEQWLADPDVDINRRNAFYLIESWRELVVNRGVEPKELARAPVSKVRDVLPAIRRGHVDVPTALADAEALSREDLRERYSGVGRPGTDGPQEQVLDAESEPVYDICASCGSRYRVRRSGVAVSGGAQ